MKPLRTPTALACMIILNAIPASARAAAEELKKCQNLPPPRAVECLQDHVETLYRKFDSIPVQPANRSIKVCIAGPFDTPSHFVVVPAPPNWKPADCEKLAEPVPADRGGTTPVIITPPPEGIRPQQWRVGCLHDGDASVSLANVPNAPSFNCGW